MDKKVKKWVAAFAAMTGAMFVFLVCAILLNTSLVSGVNKEADEKKEEIQIDIMRSKTYEGLFVDRNNLEITSRQGDDERDAVLVYPGSFSPLIGYNSKRLHLSDLRLKYYDQLFDGGKDGVGATVKLTVDALLQESLYGLMDGAVGSVSVINANTGEILACVSKNNAEVEYNVNIIDEVYSTGEDGKEKCYYSDLYNTCDKMYYNRAVLAEDPPGSTAKVMTATSLITNGMADLSYTDADGTFDYDIVNYGKIAYGSCNLQKALTNSVNTYFANAGVTLGGAALKKTFESFMVGQTVELDFATLKSNFSNSAVPDRRITAYNAYGQGELVLSPLHVAMMIGAIINDEGVMVKPYIVSDIVNDGKTKYRANKEILSEVITDKKDRHMLQEMLHNNAESYGLCENIGKDTYVIAKTGTAETGKNGYNHIYYAFAVKINGTAYGVCIDEADTYVMSSTLNERSVRIINLLEQFTS